MIVYHQLFLYFYTDDVEHLNVFFSILYRNRFRDRRPDRRDDFHRDRDDYRDRSPGYGGFQ